MYIDIDIYTINLTAARLPRRKSLRDRPRTNFAPPRLGDPSRRRGAGRSVPPAFAQAD